MLRASTSRCQAKAKTKGDSHSKVDPVGSNLNEKKKTEIVAFDQYFGSGPPSNVNHPVSSLRRTHSLIEFRRLDLHLRSPLYSVGGGNKGREREASETLNLLLPIFSHTKKKLYIFHCIYLSFQIDNYLASSKNPWQTKMENSRNERRST